MSLIDMSLIDATGCNPMSPLLQRVISRKATTRVGK